MRVAGYPCGRQLRRVPGPPAAGGGGRVERGRAAHAGHAGGDGGQGRGHELSVLPGGAHEEVGLRLAALLHVQDGDLLGHQEASLGAGGK